MGVNHVDNFTPMLGVSIHLSTPFCCLWITSVDNYYLSNHRLIKRPIGIPSSNISQATPLTA